MLRIYGFSTRNKVAGVLLLLVALGAVGAMLLFGLVLAAGLLVVGTVLAAGAAIYRLLGGTVRPAPPDRHLSGELDPALEVFGVERRRLESETPRHGDRGD